MNETPNESETSRKLLRSGMATLETVSHVLFAATFGPSDAIWLSHNLKRGSHKVVELLRELWPHTPTEAAAPTRSKSLMNV